jgi:hypothetical protein
MPLFVHHADMERLWGHGATRTERLQDINNVGAYFTAYLSNVPLTDEVIQELELDEDDIEIRGPDTTKRYLKGERLKLYGEYMQIWRKSRGIKHPSRQELNYYPDLDENYNKSHYTVEHVIAQYENEDDGTIFEVKVKTEQRRKKKGNG